jgi:hypothetical protein
VFGNAAFGESALDANTSGALNTAFGQNALTSNSTASANTAFGSSALLAATVNGNSTGVGSNCLLSATGEKNTAIGSRALQGITTGFENEAIGFNAGRFIADGVTSNATSNKSIFIGADTKALANAQTNQIVIGHNAIGNGSNTATIGNSSIVATYLQGQVKVGSFASAPTGIEGAIYYDSVTKKHYGFDGTTWNAFY